MVAQMVAQMVAHMVAQMVAQQGSASRHHQSLGVNYNSVATARHLHIQHKPMLLKEL